MESMRLDKMFWMLLVLIFLGGCALRGPHARAYELAWQEARGASPVIQSTEDLQQRLATMQRLAAARKLALDEEKCKAYRDRQRCLEARERLDFIVVTGSRISTSDIITNNQEAGVDEGGIVKKSGDYLIVLRRGTLYSIALNAGGRNGVRVIDRQLAASDDSGAGVWYDEILALDGRIVLLGYGGGTQLIGFRLDAAGRLHRDWHYTLSSQDYFSGGNYGMRLHGDRLVFKQSLDLDFTEPVVWPAWRRAGEDESAARPLVEVPQILMPGLVSDRPSLHLLLSCPLPALDAGRFECNARGVLSDGPAELYVGQTSAYLALPGWDDSLYLDPRFNAWHGGGHLSDRQLSAAQQTWLVRFPLSESAAPSMARIRGTIYNQFWLKEQGSDLHALSDFGGVEDLSLLVYRVQPSDFSHTGSLIAPRHSLAGVSPAQVRITGRAAYLVQGRGRFEAETAQLLVVDLHTDSIAQLNLGFWPARLEPALGHMVLGGAARGAMRFALLPDQARPYVLDQIDVPGYRQSESRSHAFNSGSPQAGRAVFGLPVVPTQRVRSHDDDEAVSDLLLVDMSAQRLRQLGVVDMASHSQPEPDCQLSCYDWYGNARVFFVGERIFALSADQLVELRLLGERLQEIERIRLSD